MFELVSNAPVWTGPGELVHQKSVGGDQIRRHGGLGGLGPFDEDLGEAALHPFICQEAGDRIDQLGCYPGGGFEWFGDLFFVGGLHKRYPDWRLRDSQNPDRLGT